VTKREPSDQPGSQPARPGTPRPRAVGGRPRGGGCPPCTFISLHPPLHSHHAIRLGPCGGSCGPLFFLIPPSTRCRKCLGLTFQCFLGTAPIVCHFVPWRREPSPPDNLQQRLDCIIHSSMRVKSLLLKRESRSAEMYRVHAQAKNVMRLEMLLPV